MASNVKPKPRLSIMAAALVQSGLTGPVEAERHRAMINSFSASPVHVGVRGMATT